MQEVVAMVMGFFFLEKGSCLYKETYRERYKKPEQISDLRPPSVVSTKHVKILFKGVHCLGVVLFVHLGLLSEHRQGSRFNLEP